MNIRTAPALLSCGSTIVMALALSTLAAAASSMSTADKTFVAMVSQGGMFEVVASRLAKTKAFAQNVKDQANTEVHDHQLVGAKLMAITSANGIHLPAQLNARFRMKVAALDLLSGKAFDNAYIGQMKTIHAADGAAFAKEAMGGENPALRAFAAETVLIVKRHIGSLNAVGPEM